MYHVLTSFRTQYVLAMLVKRALERNSPKTITKKMYKRSPLIWNREGPDNRFGGRLSGLALQYIAPSIMCTYSCSYWLFLSCSSGYCEKSKTAFTLQLFQQSVSEPDMLKVIQSPLPSIDPILLQYSSSDPVPQTGLTTGYTPPHEKTTNFVRAALNTAFRSCVRPRLFVLNLLLRK